MTTFQAVNPILASESHSVMPLPTDPRPSVDYPSRDTSMEDSAITPTRNSFLAANGKRPHFESPVESFPSHRHSLPARPLRADSHSTKADSHNVGIDDSDEGEDVSDTESVDDETGRPSKKKKSLRFFCSDYPPCNLSFTRSEHLARHIRKHTGERPFQCHCARRFSRLDNLRQHAQTVHVNEEIPGDSLAATGTRFQRQMRPDRARPAAARPRASTSSTQGSHARGHARNLSTSSITSTTSTVSTISSLSRDDTILRRRPQTLVMAGENVNRARLPLDTFGHTSPSVPGTPTSLAYSNGPNSPYGSVFGSPHSSNSRPLSLWDGRPSGRRSSVPSSGNPFNTSQAPTSGYHSPLHAGMNPLSPSNASHTSTYSSILASPTASTFSLARRDAAEADWRRRTWHPSSYSAYPRSGTSGHVYAPAPDTITARPLFGPSLSATQQIPLTQIQRLPGIEAFDQMSQRPSTPPRQITDESIGGGVTVTVTAPSDRFGPGPNDRRGHASWDLSLHRNLTRLAIAPTTSQENGWGAKEGAKEGSWGSQVLKEMHLAAGQGVQVMQIDGMRERQGDVQTEPPRQPQLQQEHQPQAQVQRSQLNQAHQSLQQQLHPSHSQQQQQHSRQPHQQQHESYQQHEPSQHQYQPSLFPQPQEAQKRSLEFEHYRQSVQPPQQQLPTSTTPNPPTHTPRAITTLPTRDKRSGWYRGPPNTLQAYTLPTSSQKQEQPERMEGVVMDVVEQQQQQGTQSSHPSQPSMAVGQPYLIHGTHAHQPRQVQQQLQHSNPASNLASSQASNQLSNPGLGSATTPQLGPAFAPIPKVTYFRPQPDGSSSSEGMSTPSSSMADHLPSTGHANGLIEGGRGNWAGGRTGGLSGGLGAFPPSKRPLPSFGAHPESPSTISTQSTAPMAMPKSHLTGLEALVAVATRGEKARAFER